ncbi:hypothetical protein HanXRQr2_Chr02g0070571 [Helianthus annuus]|uniref:Uncharacterized protein n=2 Tax=Helianthus annuus TaxID=4232 RepID=A0A9K3JNC1_HELAN|nr:hypothetical protein HanXRQr2_Chr02g0070571 [Helianthus annuus]KAJ0605057.1 hypothetical protein HanHA300_Chr02g0058691 [Helianthus annuus]KAJ0777523.1 hypothetical protein HanLR1_Chr02g0061431 [Helianthus annuus]
MRMTIAKRCGSPFKPHLLGGSLAFLVVLWLHTHHLMRRWLIALIVPNFPQRNSFPSISKKLNPNFPHKNSLPSCIQKIKPQNFLSSSKHLSSPPSVCRLLNLEAIQPKKTGRNPRQPQPHMVSP